jgi:hypothetical protein
MENQTQSAPPIASHDLLSLVESKRAEIRVARSDLKKMVDEMKRMKKEETAAKNAAQIAEISRNFSGLWAEVIASGMNAKEVVSLQNLDSKLRDVGDILGVTAERARQIRVKAERKMRHPKRHDLARKLGMSVRLFIDDDNVEAWHPLPGAPLRFRFRVVATLRLRLRARSGLPSAGLFCNLLFETQNERIDR